MLHVGVVAQLIQAHESRQRGGVAQARQAVGTGLVQRGGRQRQLQSVRQGRPGLGRGERVPEAQPLAQPRGGALLLGGVSNGIDRLADVAPVAFGLR